MIGLRGRLLVLAALLVCGKVALWSVQLLERRAPPGFKSYRVPEANLRVRMPASPEVERSVREALNGGLREEFRVRSVAANGVEYGVAATFRDTLVQLNPLGDMKVLFPGYELHGNNGCTVGKSADRTVEAVLARVFDRQWIIYTVRPNSIDRDEAMVDRFFLNADIYDAARSWPLLTLDDIGACAAAQLSFTG
jgi:hypothetical protein